MVINRLPLFDLAFLLCCVWYLFHLTVQRLLFVVCAVNSGNLTYLWSTVKGNEKDTVFTLMYCRLSRTSICFGAFASPFSFFLFYCIHLQIDSHCLLFIWLGEPSQVIQFLKRLCFFYDMLLNCNNLRMCVLCVDSLFFQW